MAKMAILGLRLVCYFMLGLGLIQLLGAYHGLRGTDPLDGLRGGTPLTPEELKARRRDGLERLGCGGLLWLVAIIILLWSY